MPDFLRKLTVRQWILLLVLIPVAILFFRKRVLGAVPSIPTRAGIEAEQDELDRRRGQLQELQAQLATQEGDVASLRRVAAPLWKISDRSAARQKGIIQREVNRLIDRANIRGVDYQVMNPKRREIPEMDHVYEVEVTVNITASMKEITRVLAEIDQSERLLNWSQCSITPYNLRDPNKVRLTGTLRALVLSPDVVEFLEPEETAEGSG